jgi:hypothetical protein
MPAWIAKDAGIFEKNGLDVQLVFFTGGTTAVMALVSPTRRCSVPDRLSSGLKDFPLASAASRVFKSSTDGHWDSFDASFVRELDKSGFTDGLYKKR